MDVVRDQKSVGHITFHGDFEFFEVAGEVYRAKRSDPLLVLGRRSGRWECSRGQFDHFRSVIAPIE